MKMKSVRLLSPKNSQVKLRANIRGRLSPEMAGKPVQLFVLARDGMWYLQDKTVWRNKKSFSAEIVSGDEVTPVGSCYPIAAVVTDVRGQGPFAELPEGEQDVIIVERVPE